MATEAFNTVARSFAPPSSKGVGASWNQVEGLVPEGVNAAEVASNWFAYVHSMMTSSDDWIRGSWQKLTADSLRTTLMQCASLGMYPGPQSHVYIIPYGSTATLVPGYKGLIALMKRNPDVSHVDADVVFEGDHFRVARGLHPILEHEPRMDRSADAPIVAAYAVVHYKSNRAQFVTLGTAEIDRLMKEFAGKKKSPWKSHPDRMARKSALRQLFNLVGVDAATSKHTLAVGTALDLVDREAAPMAYASTEPARMDHRPAGPTRAQAPQLQYPQADPATFDEAPQGELVRPAFGGEQ